MMPSLSEQKGDDFNGLAIMDWNEFRMSAAMESVLKGYADPRMPIYFLPAKTTGDYEGLRNGLTSADMAAPLNKADANSHHGDRWNSIPVWKLRQMSWQPQKQTSLKQKVFY